MIGIKEHQALKISLLAIAIVISSMLTCFAQSNDLQAGGKSDNASLNLSSNVQVGELLYSDNFTTRKESGWTVDSDSNYTVYYKDGKYHIDVLKGGIGAREFCPKVKGLRDFVMQVEAAQEGGADDNAYGIVTRYNGGNLTYFFISGDGFYGYYKRENNTVAVPLEWKRSDAIKTGNATNMLKVVAKGDKYIFYINGIEVSSYTDSEPVSGSIGLRVEGIVDGGAYVSFDNLRVWAIKE
jgi:hypothetical protein